MSGPFRIKVFDSSSPNHRNARGWMLLGCTIEIDLPVPLIRMRLHFWPKKQLSQSFGKLSFVPRFLTFLLSFTDVMLGSGVLDHGERLGADIF